MKTAIREVANIDLDKRTFYLLEGMPVAEMALEILQIKGYVDVKNITNKDIQISENIAKRKKELFKQLCVIPKPFVGVKKLVTSTLSGCSKAVVSGSAKEEVDTIIDEIFGIDAFDVIINGDQFEGKGKPDWTVAVLLSPRGVLVIPKNIAQDIRLAGISEIWS